MESLQEQLERLIDEVEGNEMTTTEILLALNMLKSEMEDYNLRREEYTGGSINWEDLE